jgi:hypothetical protein
VLVDPMQAGDPGHASKGLQCSSSAGIMVHRKEEEHAGVRVFDERSRLSSAVCAEVVATGNHWIGNKTMLLASLHH